MSLRGRLAASAERQLQPASKIEVRALYVVSLLIGIFVVAAGLVLLHDYRHQDSARTADNATRIAEVRAVAAIAHQAADDLNVFVHDESVQRVHTIGERCEMTDHQRKVLEANLPPQSQSEAAWFEGSYHRCLHSLAKVEARAGAKYSP